MNEINLGKQNKIEWEAYSRYYEKKPVLYFRAITILMITISLLLFFFKEALLIILVWLVYFVVYVQAAVLPTKTKYSLDSFGIAYYGGYLTYQQIAVFSVIKKKHGLLLRLVIQPNGLQQDLVLPSDPKEAEKIITFLEKKVPYLEELPKSEIEKISLFLGKITGLG